MPIPSRTSISLGLRIIPPGTGFVRSISPAVHPKPFTAHTKKRVIPRLELKVERDIELEREIANSKNERLI